MDPIKFDNEKDYFKKYGKIIFGTSFLTTCGIVTGFTVSSILITSIFCGGAFATMVTSHKIFDISRKMYTFKNYFNKK